MRIIDTSGVPAEDRESFVIRSSTQAVRADDGVEIVDSEGKGQTINEACVVIIDGDNYTPVPADIFDALFVPATEPAATEPTPSELTAQAQEAPGGVLSTDATGQPHTEQPTTTDTPATDTTTTDTTTTEPQTASVAGLTSTDAAGNPVQQ